MYSDRNLVCRIVIEVVVGFAPSYRKVGKALLAAAFVGNSQLRPARNYSTTTPLRYGLMHAHTDAMSMDVRTCTQRKRVLSVRFLFSSLMLALCWQNVHGISIQIAADSLGIQCQTNQNLQNEISIINPVLFVIILTRKYLHHGALSLKNQKFV